MAGITTITELYSRITPELPGCPLPLVKLTLQDVMRDFCIKTELWRETITQDLVDEQTAYTLAPTATEADIRRIVEVTIEDHEYPLDTALYEFDGDETLTLDDDIEPTADYTSGLVTKVVLVPQINSEEWDSALMNRWSEALVVGTKARLMDDDKEGWGNPRRAARYAIEYQTQLALGSIETNREHKTGSVTIAAREWL